MKYTIDRKQFLKKSCMGFCTAAVFLNTSHTAEAKDDNTELDAKQQFIFEWISCFLKTVESEVGEETKMKLMDQSSELCFSRFKEQIMKYKGDLPGFLTFLQNDWKIYTEYDEEEGVIKSAYDIEKCPCPLVHDSTPQQSKLLCYCTQGFNRRMYETILGRSVDASIKKSVLWGDNCCETEVRI
ncbi:MAG: hypothetical protein JXJ22_14610 [Bacteroidales bacterium]|nr:hypothetical protein [Bacteroidales bacterium]